MSWLSENYEKASLGAGLAVGLGFVYLGLQAMPQVEREFSGEPAGSGPNVSAVSCADQVEKTIQSHQIVHQWVKGEDPYGRKVDLFTGVPLFIRSSQKDKAIDLTKKDEPSVHPPIPNQWWLDNGLDPGYEKAPQQDPDADGFTNLEEFHAKSDPINVRSHPPLHHKLKFVRDESMVWVLRPSYGVNGAFPFTYNDGKGRTYRRDAANPVQKDELFFSEGAQKNRFKFLGSELRREVNERMNIETETTWVIVEDQKPNKMGIKYEFPAPLPRNRMNHFRQFDRKAIFVLDALGLSGREFYVEENNRFALPPDAEQKDYCLKSVTKDQVIIEYKPAGGTVEITKILKGSMPSLQP